MNALFSNAVGPAPAVLLLVLAVTCAVTDLLRERIYNAVTYPAIVAGFVLQAVLHGPAGLWLSLAGFAAGFFPALVMLPFGGVGGGDVKLLGAIGAIAGALPVTETLILSFLFGGLMSLGILAWHGELFRSLGRLVRVLGGLVVPGLPRVPLQPPDQPKRTLRFGLAICVAALATLWDLRSGALTHLVLG